MQIPDEIKRRFIIGKIKDIFTKLLVDVKNGEIPVLCTRSRHDWRNCAFDEEKYNYIRKKIISGFVYLMSDFRMVLKQADVVRKTKISLKYKRQRDTFNLIIFIIGKIIDLLMNNNYNTKR